MSVSDKQIKINDLSAVLNYRGCCLGHGSWEIEIILVLNNYNFEETDVRRNAEARVCLMHILIKKKFHPFWYTAMQYTVLKGFTKTLGPSVMAVVLCSVVVLLNCLCFYLLFASSQSAKPPETERDVERKQPWTTLAW